MGDEELFTHDVVSRAQIGGPRRGEKYHKACFEENYAYDEPGYLMHTCFSEACSPGTVCAHCRKPLRRTRR